MYIPKSAMFAVIPADTFHRKVKNMGLIGEIEKVGYASFTPMPMNSAEAS